MPTRARAQTSRRRTPARDSGVREPRRGPLPGAANRPAALRSRPVLDAGICERRTRLAGPLFRPAGCAVARAGVRRPFRGRRPSRPRDGGRTGVPGPAVGGVRPAGGCRRSERVGLRPLRGRMGGLCVQANLPTWHGAKAGADGAARPEAAGRQTRTRAAADGSDTVRPASLAGPVRPALVSIQRVGLGEGRPPRGTGAPASRRPTARSRWTCSAASWRWPASMRSTSARPRVRCRGAAGPRPEAALRRAVDCRFRD